MSKDRMNEKFSYQDILRKQENCERTETAYQYFEKALSEKDREEFEQHLKTCQSCVNLLAGLQESDTAVAVTIIDPVRAEAIFDQSRHEFRKRLGLKTVDTKFHRFVFPPYVNIAMILVIAILVYPLYLSFVRYQQIESLQNRLHVQEQKNIRTKLPAPQLAKITQPVISPTAVYPVRIERSHLPRTIRVEFSNQQNIRTLVFALSSLAYDSYMVQISRADQTVWHQQINQQELDSSSALISITLYSGYLKPDNYVLKIFGSHDRTQTELSEYTLIVVENK